jgi:hypothetical protein
MALIRPLTHKHMERNSLHEEIDATYTTFERDNRQILGKKSQCIQLDRTGAMALYRFLKREFALD